METNMSAITIRNLKDETHRAIKARAIKNARSTEAEIRAILDEVANPQQKGVGTLLYEFGQKFGGLELNIERDKSPIEPAVFD
jgi:antitoxin FitA